MTLLLLIAIALGRSIVLEKRFGETRVVGDDDGGVSWQWPAR